MISAIKSMFNVFYPTGCGRVRRHCQGQAFQKGLDLFYLKPTNTVPLELGEICACVKVAEPYSMIDLHSHLPVNPQKRYVFTNKLKEGLDVPVASVMLRDHSMFLCLDDMKVGEPGFPVAAAERGRRVLTAAGSRFLVGDHDFTKISLVPSVVLDIPIPEDVSESWYSGQVHVGLKEGTFEPSSPCF